MCGRRGKNSGICLNLRNTLKAHLGKGQGFVFLVLPLLKLPLPQEKGLYGNCNLEVELPLCWMRLKILAQSRGMMIHPVLGFLCTVWEWSQGLVQFLDGVRERTQSQIHYTQFANGKWRHPYTSHFLARRNPVNSVSIYCKPTSICVCVITSSLGIQTDVRITVEKK